MDEPSPVNGGVVQQPTEFKPGDTISPSGAVVTNPTVSQPTVLVAAPDSIAPTTHATHNGNTRCA